MRYRWSQPIRRMLRRLKGDERGSALLFAGLGLFVLIGSAGIAIDMSRLQSVRAKLSHALDAAGLAAGAKAHSADIDEVVDNYMSVNFPAGYMDSTLAEVSVEANEDNTVLTLSAAADVNMTFMRVFGIETRRVSVTSEITRENRGLELVMVLDTTGSMASGGKIAALRTAATDMVNILFGQRETLDNLWIALVPYVTAVNVGPDKTSWLRDYSLSHYPPEYPSGATKWKGCVESRGQSTPSTPGNGLDMTDDPPQAGNPDTLFPMYLWPDDMASNNWIRTTTRPRRTTVHLNEGPGYTAANGSGPNISCGNQVTPFTADRTTIQNAINALVPWMRSGTMSNEGMAWGWRMISPRWRGLWGNPDLPLDYNTPLMSKAVIIMTDGINEIGADYTSYGPVNARRIAPNISTASAALTALNNKFATLCTRMKQEGIVIYAVTFQLGTSTSHNNARTLFRNCASHPDYYFDSPDAATLRQAFRSIGDSLANLMISR